MNRKLPKDERKVYCESLSCGALIVGDNFYADTEFGVLCPGCFYQLNSSRQSEREMSSEDDTGYLFNPDEPDKWQDHWKNMPEMVQEDMEPYKTLRVHFKDEKAIKEFAKAIGQKIPTHNNGKIITSIWYPPKQKFRNAHLRWVSEEDEDES